MAAILPALLLTGCQLSPDPRQQTPRPPAATHSFTLQPGSDVVGEVQRITAAHEDTFSDLARRFNLGYEELVRANPGIDPWLPREGTEIVLPTRFVLPDAPRSGIVINLAALRLYYFPPTAAGEPQRVITHPIGIGRVGWRTPEGQTTVTRKQKDPPWYPPASVRREHAANGDPLPPRVEPGPDNPLGRHVLRLGWPSYLIHGTNNPYAVGLRASHGCVRLYPEDIALLYAAIPLGTLVTVVNQPVVYGWDGTVLYQQAYPPLEDDRRDQASLEKRALEAAARRAPLQGRVDGEAAGRLLTERRGIALPVQSETELAAYLAATSRVQNRLPDGATWSGSDRQLAVNEEMAGEATDTAPGPATDPSARR
jgi:L,D-transpeptidase ErfK/SrfK